MKYSMLTAAQMSALYGIQQRKTPTYLVQLNATTATALQRRDLITIKPNGLLTKVALTAIGRAVVRERDELMRRAAIEWREYLRETSARKRAEMRRKKPARRASA